MLRPLAFATSLVVSLLATTLRAETAVIDPVHSSVLFRIKHLNTSWTWGRFNDVQGGLALEGGVPREIDVTVSVDSVDTANAKRDEHLKGPDFFNAKQFPAITFQSTKVTQLDDTHYDVEGELTLHGVKENVRIRLEKTGSGRTPMTGPVVGFAAKFKIKRSDFGMKTMVGPVGDEVLIIVALECSVK